MEIKLSILICTTSARSEIIKPLLANISSQFTQITPVEVIIDAHETNNVGTKRNNLLCLAKGNYVVFIDDDDFVSNKYIQLILDATKNNSDCIGINGYMTTNGANRKNWYISKDYGSWYERDNCYYRTTNHISPVRRELALKAGFPNISFAEDYEYSMRLLPLLKTETKISQPLYHYAYRNDK